LDVGHESASEQSVCPTLQLSNFRPGAKRSRDLKSRRKKLEAAGPVSFETVKELSGNEYIDALFRLHATRWQQRRESGVLAHPNLKSFHTAVACGFGRHGFLRFHGLRFNEALMAVLYWFQHRRRVYSYIPAFDPAYSQYGPGSLLHYYALQYAAEAGDVECDFLRGAEEYKYRWGAQDRKNYRLPITKELQD